MAPRAALLLLLSLSVALAFLALWPSTGSGDGSTLGRQEREILAVPRAATLGDLGRRAAGGGARSVPVHPSDAAALLEAAADFARADSDGARGLLSTWDARGPCSEWHGLTCDPASGRVTRLNLTAGKDLVLSGKPPAALGLLPELQTLILAGNALDLQRGFPSSWDRLAKLAHLDLSDSVSAVGGDINGLPPLGELTSLTYLNLAECNFGVLNFEDLPLRDLGRLTRLAFLDLSRNPALVGHIGEAIPVVASLHGLTSLALESMAMSELPDGSESAPLQGPALGPLSRLAALERLNLKGTGGLGPLPTWLSVLTRLSYLDLSFTGSNPGTTGTARVGPGSLPAWLGSLQQLTSLDLSSSGLVGSLPPELGRFSRLARLHLRDNGLTGQLPPQLGQLKMLEDMDLGANALSGAIPAEFGGLKALGSLRLGHNALSGGIPAELGSLPSLTHLSLASNNLSGSLPNSLIRPGLLLEVQNNRLSGPLPPSVGRLVEAFLKGALSPVAVPGVSSRPLPMFPLLAYGNFLCGPCFGSAVLKCNAADFGCAVNVTAVLRGLGGNCLKGCPTPLVAPASDVYPFENPLPQDRSKCSRSCGSDD